MLSLPTKPKITKQEKNKAIFEIEALYPGYGVTVGNSLRRVLLSSLAGAAITQVKIKNVPHEFSTIPGVLEDVIQIMLNLKQLRFKIYTEEPQKAALKIKGEKKVKGSDFEIPAQLELANKDYHIATITDKKTELEIEIQVEKGIGYSPREARKKEKLEIGTIPLDAIFTPVRQIAFRVENMRVGERTDFDRLFLEVETDGTILPEDAFCQASEILKKQFGLFAETFKLAEASPNLAPRSRSAKEEVESPEASKKKIKQKKASSEKKAKKKK